MQKEEWRGITEYPNYEVSNLGRVRSWNKPGKGKELRATPKVLKNTMHNTGYYAVCLRSETAPIRVILVHTLVLMMFDGPRPAGAVSRHLDGNCLNNNIDNLRYGTPKENSEDRTRHGNNNMSRGVLAKKLSDAEAVEIYNRAQAGETARSIHADYPQVSLRLVRYVAAGTRRTGAIKALETQGTA